VFVNRLLDGFEGTLTSSQMGKSCQMLPGHSHSDINDLVKRGVLAKDVAGGRSTSYAVNDPAEKTASGP
jgi:Fic family protein